MEFTYTNAVYVTFASVFIDYFERLCYICPCETYNKNNIPADIFLYNLHKALFLSAERDRKIC